MSRNQKRNNIIYEIRQGILRLYGNEITNWCLIHYVFFSSYRRFCLKIDGFAKNYLSEQELTQLNRIVSSYLDFAEDMAERRIPLTMQDWEKRLNSFIEMFQYGLLQDAGKVTAEIAKLHAETEFEKYRVVQDKLFMSDYDRFLIELEEHIEG